MQVWCGGLDVRDCGAVGDGTTLDTKAIQRAIDSCSLSGGRVVLRGGRFLSGTLFLRSNVTLEIADGATLLGSTDVRDYPIVASPIPTTADVYHTQSLIVGIDLENVALVGRGTIDGQGRSFVPVSRKKPERYKNRPNGIRLIRCRNVLVENLRMRNSGKWMQHYFACNRVTIRGITVDNNCNMNNDMLDIDGCRDVTISDCSGQSDDDGITLKSTSAYPCENVAITNCIVGSHCNAVKLGTESCGGFRNVTISNIVIRPSSHDSVIFGTRNGLAGIALLIVDGGILDGVLINNIRIDGPRVPLFLRLGDRGADSTMPRPAIGRLRNVAISNIVATGADSIGCAITGLPGHPIENVSLSNVQMSSTGGGAVPAGYPPELPSDYPESGMFGTLPAYGFFIRHATGITFSNITLRTTLAEARPSIASHDVNGLDLRDVRVKAGANAETVFSFDASRDVVVRGTIVSPRVPYLASVTGSSSMNIRFYDNDLSNIGSVVHLGPGVEPNAARGELK